MLGYPPQEFYRGRGSFESMGAGLPMEPGDIAFKCNFATLDEQTNIVVKRRADRNFEGMGPVLCDFLNGSILPSFPEHQVAVKYATEHRCGVRIRGPLLTDAISGTDPLVDEKPLLRSHPLDETVEADVTSKIVNELSEVIHSKLRDHPINKDRISRGKSPANVVLLRGPGARIKAPTFLERHSLRAFMIAPTCIIAGLGMSVGIDIVQAPGATGDYHTNLASKATTGVSYITGKGPVPYDFGFVHVKAVDDAGHDKNVALKVEFLEKIDAMIGQMVLQLADNEVISNLSYIICVTGDHSTPVLYGDHSHEPVPFAIGSVSGIAALLRSRGVGQSSSGVPTPLTESSGSEHLLITRIGKRSCAQVETEKVNDGSEINEFHVTSTEEAAVLRDNNVAVKPKIDIGSAGSDNDGVLQQQHQQDSTENIAISREYEAKQKTAASHPHWKDDVRTFSELDAFRGLLGRFPGSQMMYVIKSFAGWNSG